VSQHVLWYGTVSYRLSVGGLGAVLLVMSGLDGLAAVAAARSAPRAQLAWLLALLAAANGVFLASDAVLFYVFWEGMLVPAYFLIAAWGGAGRRRAALQFLAYNVAGSLFILAAVAAVVAGARGPAAAPWLLAGFGLAFAVKTPLWPFHGWLADAYAEAPAPAAALIAGVQSKAGLYGFLALGTALFPGALLAWRPWLLALGLVGVLYGAFLAFAQRDARRLVAYSSLSHLSLVFLGVLAMNATARSGAALEMWSHGVFTAALFLLVGMLEVRLGRIDLTRLGGLARHMPAFAGLLTLSALAALGLPGLAGFPGELLILVGLFYAAPGAAILASAGVLLAAVYFLRLIQALLHDRPAATDAAPSAPDLRGGERWLLVPLLLPLVAAGLWPEPLLALARVVAAR
jgi:NADH-quinone oxidoreductase subunit M